MDGAWRVMLCRWVGATLSGGIGTFLCGVTVAAGAAGYVGSSSHEGGCRERVFGVGFEVPLSTRRCAGVN
jgi:hypothetical protein